MGQPGDKNNTTKCNIVENKIARCCNETELVKFMNILRNSQSVRLPVSGAMREKVLNASHQRQASGRTDYS